MKLVMQVALFLFVFTIEVRVRAETLRISETKAPLLNPKNCVAQTNLVCAMETAEGEKFTLKLESGLVTLAPETTLVRNAADQIRLLRGRIWIQPASGKTITTQTEFGWARAQAEYWIERSTESMSISATGGDVEIQARASSEILTIPHGLENTIGRVGRNGVATVHLPVPVDPKLHLKRWAELYSGAKSAFEKEVATFKAGWTKGKDEASAIHQALYERKLASIQAEAKLRAASRRKLESRDRELRDQFRSKFLSGE